MSFRSVRWCKIRHYTASSALLYFINRATEKVMSPAAHALLCALCWQLLRFNSLCCSIGQLWHTLREGNLKIFYGNENKLGPGTRKWKVVSLWTFALCVSSNKSLEIFLVGNKKSKWRMVISFNATLSSISRMIPEQTPYRSRSWCIKFEDLGRARINCGQFHCATLIL